MFAHCYKKQHGWKDVLSRFSNGGGLLLDLEFLTLNGRRVAAFGYYAGYISPYNSFAGAAIAFDVWAHQVLNGEATYPKIEPFENENGNLSHLKSNLSFNLTYKS
jgi:saccharopine dehydrogenase (NAD+, L-lysine-forming)